MSDGIRENGGEMRERFEAWAKEQGYDLRSGDDGYSNGAVQNDWYVWLAALAAAQPKREESFRRAEATTAVPGGDASTAQRQDASHQPKREEGLRSVAALEIGIEQAHFAITKGFDCAASDFCEHKSVEECVHAALDNLAASPASGYQHKLGCDDPMHNCTCRAGEPKGDSR